MGGSSEKRFNHCEAPGPRRRKSWKRALLLSAPNSGMHQTLVGKRSEELWAENLGEILDEVFWASACFICCHAADLLEAQKPRKFKSSSKVTKKIQDKFDHDKGQKSAISGCRLHWRLSTEFFAFSPVFMCNLVRRAP